MRNSLRLFGLLAVLAGVNVYVFFFNRGTAPREVLKPSSMVRGAETKTDTIKRSTAEAAASLEPGTADAFARPTGAVLDKRAKVPTPMSTPTPASAPSAQRQVDREKPKPKPGIAVSAVSAKTISRVGPGAAQRGVAQPGKHSVKRPVKPAAKAVR